MSGFDTSAALKTFGFAVAGYLVVLAIGVGIGLSMDDDGFAGLGIIAVTTVIAAPVGAAVGAYIGMKRFGSRGGRRRGIGVLAAIAIVGVGLMLVVEPPAQFMVPPLALALALILRSGVREPMALGIPEDTAAV